jgi:glycosyltransferase involved in cell wall biosynthesis
MRILFISLYDPFGTGSGPGTHLKYLSQELRNVGCEVHILVCGQKKNAREVNGIELHYVNSPFSVSICQGLISCFSSIGMINEICKQYGIDVVHGQSPSSFGYALLSRARRSYIVTLHGTSFGEISSYFTTPIACANLDLVHDAMFTQPLWAFLTNIEYKCADRVVAVSKAMAQEAAGFYRLPKEKIVAIPNGVNLPHLSDTLTGQRNMNHTILFVGRLIWRKGVKYLIDAIPQILAEYPDTKLLIVGNGEQKSFLEGRIKRFGIKNSVHFLGNVSEERLYSLYHEADVYVQPSLYEPLAIAILEAMSMKKPIVATRVGGTPELITDGEEGILVEPANSSQLAKAIMTVLSSPSYSKKLGLKGRNKVEKEFSWKKIAERTLALYEEVLRA